MADESRTVREFRLRVQELEAELGQLAMSPAASLVFAWNLRDARLALRRLDRDASRSDDPRLPGLKVLRSQILERQPFVGPRRKKHRCDACWVERLLSEDDSKHCRRRRCDGTMEPVRPLRRTR